MSKAMDEMYTPGKENVSSPVKHKEEGANRWELNKQERQRILVELQKHSHPLTDLAVSLYNINNRQVATQNTVNVQDSVRIGQEMHTSFMTSLPDGFFKPIN